MMTEETSRIVEEAINDVISCTGNLDFLLDIAKDQLNFFQQLKDWYGAFETIDITQETANEYRQCIVNIFKYFNANEKWPKNDSTYFLPENMKVELLWRIHMLNPFLMKLQISLFAQLELGM